ncbi:MAG: SusD/RagB family nutrient-binding outer membrane lipoprotein [Porphyromonas sp.]|nr:SusD/RagB family nutrient-binding outer membrane lipoprotein [Porphyromonas sp.]
MKKIYQILLALIIAGGIFSSCSDFEEINRNPFEANSSQVKVEYFINNAIIGAQMDPHIAERAFVLYWKDSGHMDRLGTLSQNYADDGWSGDYFRYVTTWLTNINAAINLYEEQQENDMTLSFSNNLYQVARIWRVYLMSEFTDNFGSMPINGFQGEKVTFNTVEEIYQYLLTELREAVNGFDGAVINESAKKQDPAYAYDFTKWKKYGNSMRMRLSMRLSEADPALAKREFEDAVKSGDYISDLTDNFAVQERPGWDALSGVMSRTWNMQYLSSTLNNLYTGLGGVTSEEQIGDYAKDAVNALNEGKTKDLIELKFNDPDWLGVRWPEHFSIMTNDPSAGYWNDGLNHIMDPRAYRIYNIPGDINNPLFCSYGGDAVKSTLRVLLDPASVEANKKDKTKEVDTLAVINSAFAWNAPTTGNWGEMSSYNQVWSWYGNTPRLINNIRNNSMKRVFFASWESYFLIAEAAVRGWSVPMDGKSAYEQGIKESFAYWDEQLPDRAISKHLTTYLASTSYNRVGTSVSWDHTTEAPATVEMRYLDGPTNTIKTVNYKYPTNSIYKGGAVNNDHLNKIITQKFIAQVPWLPLETWSDHRRLGLPFFENPVVEKTIEGYDVLTKSNYMETRWEFFPQRLKYPSSLRNNVPESYNDGVSKLGGPDEIGTKMWWSGMK